MVNNGTPAPIEYTSAGVVSVIVPYEIAGAATAQILVNYQGNNVVGGIVTVAPSAPGIFTARELGDRPGGGGESGFLAQQPIQSGRRAGFVVLYPDSGAGGPLRQEWMARLLRRLPSPRRYCR